MAGNVMAGNMIIHDYVAAPELNEPWKYEPPHGGASCADPSHHQHGGEPVLSSV